MDWMNSSTGIEGGEVRALALSGDTVFAGSDGGGVFISKDGAANWAEVNSGLTSSRIWTLAVSDSNIFAGTYGGGICRSSDNGTNWIGVNNGLTNSFVLSLVVSDTTIYAGTEDGIFKTTDNGDNWFQVDDSPVSTQYGSYQCMAVTGSHIFVGSYNGLFHSPDNGTNWSDVSSGLPYNWVMDIEILDENVFALTNWGNISLSTDYGASWTIINEGVIDTVLTAIAVSDAFIYADAGYGMGIMRCSLSSILAGLDGKEGEGPLPPDISIIYNYPNPFSLSTKMLFDLPESGFVTLKVYDCSGRELHTLLDKYLPAGMHSVDFEPTNLSSGWYIYKFQAGDLVEIRKMLLVR